MGGHGGPGEHGVAPDITMLLLRTMLPPLSTVEARWALLLAMQRSDVRVAHLIPPPANLALKERWV